MSPDIVHLPESHMIDHYTTGLSDTIIIYIDIYVSVKYPVFMNWDAKDNKSNLKNLSRILSISESDVSAALKNLMNKELIEKAYHHLIRYLLLSKE